jgi:hypothetical protein
MGLAAEASLLSFPHLPGELTMRRSHLLVTCLTLLSATPALAEAAPETTTLAETPGATAPDADHWRLHAEYDLGVLSFGGLGVHAGVARGPWTTGLGFYRFESKNLFGGALGGFDDAFTLHVDYILAAQIGYFFNGETNDGFYGKLIYQAKQQTVTHIATRDQASLTSHLLGPELGYEWDFFAGFFLRPRVGALYYVKPPQPGRDPVPVGGAEYDNPTHNWVDAYVTADVGFEFDL